MPYPRFDLSHSLVLTSALILLHGLSLVIVAILSLAVWLKFLLAVGMLISAWHSIVQQGLRTSSTAICACWLDQRAWHLQRQDKQVILGQLQGSSFISPYLSILNFSCAKQTLAVIIMPDAIDPEKYRHLRVYLKINA